MRALIASTLMAVSACAPAPCGPALADQLGKVFPIDPYGAALPPPACALAAADVIIVLGCPSNEDGTPSECQTRRADLAVSLGRYGKRFITSGAAVHNAFVEAEALRDLLIARGVPTADITLEAQATHTDENLYYSSLIMSARGWQSAIVVSDDPGHLIYSALCDSNCCVQQGRLSVFDFPAAGGTTVKAGRYVLEKTPSGETLADCKYLSRPETALCINLANRNACRGRLALSR